MILGLICSSFLWAFLWALLPQKVETVGKGGDRVIVEQSWNGTWVFSKEPFRKDVCHFLMIESEKPGAVPFCFIVAVQMSVSNLLEWSLGAPSERPWLPSPQLKHSTSLLLRQERTSSGCVSSWGSLAMTSLAPHSSGWTSCSEQEPRTLQMKHLSLHLFSLHLFWGMLFKMAWLLP